MSILRSDSVVRSDQDALNIAIDVHFDRRRPWPPLIWDCTYGDGTMWQGMDIQPQIRTDIEPSKDGVLHADYMILHEAARIFGCVGLVDVLVFDPPHAMHGGEHGGMDADRWGRNYGTRTAVTQTRSLSIADTFCDFLLAARKVLLEDGIVVAKIGDQTHGARQQWEHCRLVGAAQAVGMTPCDLIIKVRREAKRRDPKHKAQYHVDKVHSFFVVIRNSTRCMRHD